MWIDIIILAIVCPLVPISGITLEETASYAQKLGERVGKELGIPGYFYEAAAMEKKRVNLANCRAGEYEGLKKKLSDALGKLNHLNFEQKQNAWELVEQFLKPESEQKSVTISF